MRRHTAAERRRHCERGGRQRRPFCVLSTDRRRIERSAPEHAVERANPAPGLRRRCPRCGEGKLFQGFLTLRPRCDDCGLDYGFADAGDGPAVFVILIGGFIVVGRGA